MSILIRCRNSFDNNHRHGVSRILNVYKHVGAVFGDIRGNVFPVLDCRKLVVVLHDARHADLDLARFHFLIPFLCFSLHPQGGRRDCARALSDIALRFLLGFIHILNDIGIYERLCPSIPVSDCSFACLVALGFGSAFSAPYPARFWIRATYYYLFRPAKRAWFNLFHDILLSLLKRHRHITNSYMPSPESASRPSVGACYFFFLAYFPFGFVVVKPWRSLELCGNPVFGSVS